MAVLAAIGHARHVGNPVAPFFPRQALGPNLRMFLHMIVRADQTVFKFHAELLPLVDNYVNRYNRAALRNNTFSRSAAETPASECSTAFQEFG